MSGISGMRVLNACAACGRQYDVSHLKGGVRVLCQCGAHLRVELHEPRAPRALRCSSCGGNLRDAARKCEYCAAEITLEERRLSSICPKCFARAASEARFCMECGAQFEPQALAAIPEGATCPRCKAALRSRDIGHVGVVECSRCAGFWMSQQAFVRVCEESDQGGVVARALGSRTASEAPPSTGAAYVACPSCGEIMWRKNYGHASGVIIDVCRDHGVWLDHRELERILAFVRAGGLERARRREIEKLEDAKRSLRAEQAATKGGLMLEHERDHRSIYAGDVFGALIELLGGAVH